MTASNDISKYFVPTNSVNFMTEEVPTDETRCYGGYQSKENDIWTFAISKPCPSADDEVRQRALQYEVRDFIFPKYRFRYRKTKDSDWMPIPNPYLKNTCIGAYVITQDGLWYVSNDTLFFLNAKTGNNARIGRIQNVMDLNMTQNGAIHAVVCKGIKLVETNRFYSLMDYYVGYKDIYEVTIKNLTINPARFANQIKGWTQTFNCPKCHTPLYSGMTFCPQCGAALGNTENLRDPYVLNIESFTASPQMKPEGSEHYFQLEGWGDYYILKNAKNSNNHTNKVQDHYIRIAYDDRSNLLYYLTYHGYLMESTIDEKKRKVLYKLPETVGYYYYALVVNDSGIFVVSQRAEPTKILWLTKNGKEVKTIQLSGTINQTYICGDLLFFIRTEKIEGSDYGSAYWMNMRDEQAHCIVRSQWESIHKDLTPSSHNYKEITVNQIFGNQRCAVVQITALYYNDADEVPEDQRKVFESSGWYFYDFSTCKLTCITNPQGGPHLAYYRPDEYAKWQNKCREEKIEENGLSVVGFDMAKNLMWVAMKINGRDCRVPMNITTDPQKCLRPDLPVWYEPNRSSFADLFTFKRTPTYFDGERYYVFHDSFYSVEPTGKIEKWPIRKASFQLEGFSVQGDQVFISGRLPQEQGDIPGSKELEDAMLSDRIGAFRMPASHKFDRILGFSYFGLESPFKRYCDDEEEWLTRAYDEGKKADWEAYREHLEEGKVAEKKRQEEIARREKEKQEWQAAKALADAWHWDDDDEDCQGCADEGQKAPEETASPKPVIVKEPANRLEYWEGFAEYASTALDPGMTLPKAADRNWYAIRLGSAKIRIECSVNSRARSLRAAFFVQDEPEMFAKAKQVNHMIDALLLDLGTITWDENSRAANISLMTTQTGKSTREQYEWFCQAVNRLHKSILPYLGL